MHYATRPQWDALCHRLTGSPPPVHLFDALVQRYTESHRAYHTLAHIEECLAHFAEVHHLAAQPDLIAVAIWLHDVIYEPTRNDNEIASATWAQASLLEAGVAREVITQIQQLILYTQHNAQPPSGDPALLVDIDLAILGAPRARFEAYEQQIREEYVWVPWPTFCEKRAAILQQFLDRPQIYQTSYFYTQWEAAARHQLQQSLQRLNSPSRKL